MASGFNLPAPGLTPQDLAMVSALKAPSAGGKKTKVMAAAQSFETEFLNSMFQQMYTDTGNDGPFGGGGATGIWRSLLTDAYAKSFVKAGGIGISNEVYRSLLSRQASEL
jgi:Rod binding domain-containing protein